MTDLTYTYYDGGEPPDPFAALRAAKPGDRFPVLDAAGQYVADAVVVANHDEGGRFELTPDRQVTEATHWLQLDLPDHLEDPE